MGDVNATVNVKGPDWRASRTMRLAQVPRVDETVSIWVGMETPEHPETARNTSSAQVTRVHWFLPGSRVHVDELNVSITLESTAVWEHVPKSWLTSKGWTIE